MQIDSRPPGPRAPTELPAKRNDRDGSRSDRSLAWQAVFGRTGPFAAINPRRDGQLTFAASSVIGDTAVRFDARPIVAPVAEPGKQALADRSGDEHEPVAAALPTVPVIDERHADAARPALPAEAIDALPPRGATTRPEIAASATASTLLGHPSGSAVSQGAPRRATDAAGIKPIIGRAAPPPRVLVTAAAQRVTAHAFAVDDEVRIVVRGTALTAEDRTALVRTAEDTLAGTAHAGRPIQVIGKRRGA